MSINCCSSVSTVFYTQTVGPLCEYNENSTSEALRQGCNPYDDYMNSLNFTCQPGEPGRLVWTPDENTPNLTYYQVYAYILHPTLCVCVCTCNIMYIVLRTRLWDLQCLVPILHVLTASVVVCFSPESWTWDSSCEHGRSWSTTTGATTTTRATSRRRRLTCLSSVVLSRAHCSCYTALCDTILKCIICSNS